jgi:hypothetical protein
VKLPTLFAPSLALLCLAAPGHATTYDFAATTLVASVGAPPEGWLAPFTGSLEFTPGADPISTTPDTIWMDPGAKLTLSNGLTHTGTALRVDYSDGSLVRYAMNTGSVNIILDIAGSLFGLSAWAGNDTGVAWSVDTPWLDGAWHERTPTSSVPESTSTVLLLAAALAICALVGHGTTFTRVPLPFGRT